MDAAWNSKGAPSERCRIPQILVFYALLASCGGSVAPPSEPDDPRIQPYRGNPFYWQYHGQPIFLIGASDYHNIFQRPDLIEHLDRMAEAGANYVRNTMASREIFPDHRDLWPYRVIRETEDPLIPVYDLDQWNEEYWESFDRMLRETAARGMSSRLKSGRGTTCYRTACPTRPTVLRRPGGSTLSISPTEAP